MILEYAHRYDGPPEAVVALLRNPDFIADLARRADARDHTVEVDGDDVTVALQIETPAAATAFLGDTVTVTQVFRFEPAADDGSITGTVAIRVPGAPVDADASIDLDPEGSGTAARIAGELHVRVPLVGSQLERQAEPLIAKGLAEIETTAADWLGN